MLAQLIPRAIRGSKARPRPNTGNTIGSFRNSPRSDSMCNNISRKIASSGLLLAILTKENFIFSGIDERNVAFKSRSFPAETFRASATVNTPSGIFNSASAFAIAFSVSITARSSFSLLPDSIRTQTADSPLRSRLTISRRIDESAKVLAFPIVRAPDQIGGVLGPVNFGG